MIQKQDRDQVHADYAAGLVNPRPAQLRRLERAAGLLSPLLCQAVRRVAFVVLDDNPEVIGWTMAGEVQGLVYLNAAEKALWNNFAMDSSPTAQARAIQNFVHEASHAAVGFLQSQHAAGGDLLAGEVLLQWAGLHESFRARGLATRYYGDAWNDPATTDLHHPSNGFASAYGGQSPLEDMAELTGWAVAGPDFEGGARLAHKGQACGALRSRAGKGVPPELTAVHVKLERLRDLGFIEPSTFTRCTALNVKTGNRGVEEAD